jgi:hypothetical protein
VNRTTTDQQSTEQSVRTILAHIDTLRAAIDAAAEEGDITQCDVLHGRIGTLEDAIEILENPSTF